MWNIFYFKGGIINLRQLPCVFLSNQTAHMSCLRFQHLQALVSWSFHIFFWLQKSHKAMETTAERIKITSYLRDKNYIKLNYIISVSGKLSSFVFLWNINVIIRNTVESVILQNYRANMVSPPYWGIWCLLIIQIDQSCYVCMTSVNNIKQ